MIYFDIYILILDMILYYVLLCKIYYKDQYLHFLIVLNRLVEHEFIMFLNGLWKYSDNHFGAPVLKWVLRVLRSSFWRPYS